VFSFLLIVFIVLIIVTVCVSVVSTYILLNNEGVVFLFDLSSSKLTSRLSVAMG
jgi:hypothetical protein